MPQPRPAHPAAPIRAAIRLAACLALAAMAMAPAAARAFPERPVTLVVPFAAGGPTDTVARVVAEAMGRDLGQAVVVENATGAGGTIAANRVATARPDGHALLIHHIGHATTATLYRRLPYDVEKSFAPVGLVTEVAMTILARPDFPAADLGGLLAEIARRGDALNLGHSGLGGANQLCGMLIQRAAGRPLTTVVFRGSAPAITELMAGRLDVFCDQATNTVPYIREGRVKAYAVTVPERLPALPALPTSAEAGAPALDVSVWHGLYAPAGTPEAVVGRLARALRAALADPGVVARFADIATAPVPPGRATPEFHRAFLAAEVARWRPVIEAAGQYAD